MAEQKVIEKIEELMDPTKREPFLFLGNTKAHSQNFMIIGLFYPPVEAPSKAEAPPNQRSLF